MIKHQKADIYMVKHTFHNKWLSQAGSMLMCFGYDMSMREYMHIWIHEKWHHMEAVIAFIPPPWNKHTNEYC